ncbi:MAG: 3-phosphoshikimate 1-carboxyvinyltransferase [bacterium]
MPDSLRPSSSRTNPLPVTVPSSKSLTQRALVLAALCPGESRIDDPLLCDDSAFLSAALVRLGVTIEKAPGTWTINGGIDRSPDDALFCGNAGTCFRFLNAVSLVTPGGFILDGDHHLRQRPCGEIGGALISLGMTVRYHVQDGFAPIELRPQHSAAPSLTLDVSRTSQFASGLLMVGRILPAGLVIDLTGPPVSRPYLQMTLDTMAVFGADDLVVTPDRFEVPPGQYRPATYRVEGDWSAAAMVLVAARLSGREVQIDNLKSESRQGDRVIVDFLRELDRPGDHVFDLHDCPDLISPLAVAAAAAESPSRLTNVAHARIKECDRVAATAESLQAVGVAVTELPDGLVIQPASRLQPALLDPHDDHRMAMAHGLLSLREPGIETSNPDCVSKSFPEFWETLELFR